MRKRKGKNKLKKINKKNKMMSAVFEPTPMCSTIVW